MHNKTAHINFLKLGRLAFLKSVTNRKLLKIDVRLRQTKPIITKEEKCEENNETHLQNNRLGLMQLGEAIGNDKVIPLHFYSHNLIFENGA